MGRHQDSATLIAQDQAAAKGDALPPQFLKKKGAKKAAVAVGKSKSGGKKAFAFAAKK